MRWYVEATKVGSHTPPATLVVDAEAWPRALQAARAIRGESGPIADFTIELMEDGCRAIEPHGLVTYRVTTAPDDTPLGEVRGPSLVPPRPAPSSPAPRAPVRPSVTSTLLNAAPPPADLALDAVSAGWPSSAEMRVAPPAEVAAPAPVAAVAPPAPVSKPAVVPPAPPSVPASAPSVPSVPRPAPSVPSVASAPSVPVAPAAPAAPPSSSALPRSSPSITTAPTAASTAASANAEADPKPPSEDLPAAIVLFERQQAPTKEAPLHYREYAFALPPGTGEETAERVLFVELTRLKKEMATLPTGKLINLAAFDRIFTGRPAVLPLVTLTWKDWRSEPTLDHPARRGTPAAPMPLSFPPPSGAIEAGEAARISSLPSATVPSGPPSHSAELSSAAGPAPSSGSLHADMTVRIPPHDPPMTDRGDGVILAEDRHLDSLDVPQVAAAGAALVHDTLPPGPPPASGSDPFPQAPPPSLEAESQREPRSFGSIASTRSSIPRIAFPRKRGDELLSVLFEAMYDLAFLRDAVEGADFCVGLALEQIPATRGFIHLYDMDRREFVVVAGRGVAAGNRLLARTADQDARFRAVIRQAGATVDGEAVYAPIVQAGRHIGILEIDGALDHLPFGEAEGHALVYIARQYAEFVSQRGVVIDAARVSEMPRSR